MSGLEVIGGISAVVSIIDASIKIYNSARKDLKLSEAFEAVGHRLPIILDTLQTCKSHLEPIQGSMPADVCEALQQILDACDQKAGKLREIFEKVIPGGHDGWEKRYLKVFKRLGKGNKIEELMISITEDVQLIINNHAVKSAKPEHIAKLDDIIREMKSVKSSMPEEESPGMKFNSGGGAQTNNVNSGSGQQINNNAAAGSQHFHSDTVKQKEDLSFQGPAGICLGQAPYIDPKLFIGRESELDQMKEILKPGEKSREHRRLILGGKGGIGKTQLVIAFANRHRDDYKSVFWINAASEATMKDSFRSMADRLFDLQEPGVLEGEQVVIHVRRWLSDQENTHWLLIFDNYDDPGQLYIQKYYPFALHGAIVVTTRRPDLVAGREMRIEPLKNIEESLKSWRRDLSERRPKLHLAARLRGLPLALTTAGAYLHTSNFTFERYLQEYEECWNIDPRRPLQLQEYQDRTLYTTWDLSYTRLQGEAPHAAKLLKLFAYFDNQSIWYELLHAGAADDSPEWLHEVIGDDVKFAGVMRILTDYCFIEVQKSTKSWSMHNCVHDWTLAALNKGIDTQQYWYAFDCIASSINKDDWDSLGHLSYAYLAAHAQRLVQVRFRRNDLLDDIVPDRLKGAFHIAQLLTRQIRLTAAEQIYLWALAGMEQALGPEHTSTLNTVNNLGNSYRKQGKLPQAEQFYLRALAGFEQALGPAHTSTLDTVNNLGNLYRDQGNLAQAEQFYLRALAGKEQALGPEHSSTLDTVNNLGNLYSDQGKLAQAEQFYLRALAGKEQTLGPAHTSTLKTVNNLGILYRVQGKLPQAEQFCLRALAGDEQALGPAHTSTLDTVTNLGNLYSDQGKLAQAEQFYLRALAGYEQALGPEHTSTLYTVNNLGNLYSNQGKLAKAEQFFLRALAGKEQALGTAHTSTLDTVNNLGNLYSDQGKLAQAEQFYLRALAGYEQALGTAHTSTLDTVNNLGNLYSDQGKLAQAEQFYLRALAGYEQALQLENIPALNTVRNLGLLYRDQGQTEKAEEMFQRAVLGREKVLGPDHPRTLAVVNDLSKLRVVVEGNANEGQSADSHNSRRKRIGLTSLLRLKSSRAGHS